MSRDDFAESLGVTRNTIQRYEIYKRKPNTDFVETICNKYQVCADWLILGIPPKYRKDAPAAVLEQSILIDAIDTLEQVLQGTGKTMLAGDKAEIIAKIYELYTEENKGTDKEKFSNILKLVANYD